MMRSEAMDDAFRDLHVLLKAKDTSGKYIVEPDPTERAKFRLLGLPVTVTNRLPIADDPATTTVTERHTSIVLADFAQIAVARDLAPSVKILTERYADFDQQAIRVVARYDMATLNPDAIVVLRQINVP